MIRMISIRNFRSIQDQNFNIEEITTFVGSNDAGKSNILRALNLFFNGETDHKLPYNFKSDYNINAKIGLRKAKEIAIELGLKLPPSYRKDSIPNTLTWKKVWREGGEHKDGEEINLCNFRGVQAINKKALPSRSKIPSLLNNINFIYIPAIKDKDFFIELQGKIYDVLAQESEKGLHSSANTFEQSIQQEFDELLKSIDGTFSSKNSISLPKNLRGIFEKLEFNSEKIPFSQRGDGVKVRHIPAMLTFIGSRSSSGHKSPIRPQIWGFEEPENNVEYLSCPALISNFIDAAKNKTQVIITTHSPAIYNISDLTQNTTNLKSANFYVEKTQDTGTVLTEIDNQSLHHKVGFIPLIAPIIAKQQQDWQNKEDKMNGLIKDLTKDLAKDRKHRIFVEGETDKRILLKAIGIFCPSLIDIVHFDLSENNNANAVADRTKAFYLTRKHGGEIKGYSILDDDQKGRECKKEINDFISNGTGFVKVSLLNKPKRIITLIQKGFKVDAHLEALLPESLWHHALEKCWLEQKPNSDKITDSKLRELWNTGVSLEEIVGAQTSSEKILINYKFTKPGKVAMSKYISKMDEESINSNGVLDDIRSMVEDIHKFFIGNLE